MQNRVWFIRFGQTRCNGGPTWAPKPCPIFNYATTEFGLPVERAGFVRLFTPVLRKVDRRWFSRLPPPAAAWSTSNPIAEATAQPGDLRVGETPLKGASVETEKEALGVGVGKPADEYMMDPQRSPKVFVGW
jgi:hypothetical protein